MLSLLEISQTYKNSYPQYINPLAYFHVTNCELADLKREAPLPYRENMKEKMVIYREKDERYSGIEWNMLGQNLTHIEDEPHDF